MKTLLFCTAYADSASHWTERYRKWLDHVQKKRLQHDQVLLVDDGSPMLPTWRGLRTLRDLPDKQPTEKCVLFHFDDNLGRSAIRDYPGWFRSFAFAATYANRYGFDKIVHVESDCFLLSDRIIDHIEGLSSGWTAFWCPLWNFPETCIQVVCADAMEKYLALSKMSYEKSFHDVAIETALPFTQVCKDFVGDRYGEFLTYIPEDADYACQVPNGWVVE